MSGKLLDIRSVPLPLFNEDICVGLYPHASKPLTYEDNVWDLTSDDYGPDKAHFHIAVGKMLSQLADPKKGKPVQLAYVVAMNLMDKDGKVVFKDEPSGQIMKLPEVESQACSNLTVYAQKWETGDPTILQDWPFVLGIALLVIRGQYRPAKSSSSRMKRDSALTEIINTFKCCAPSDRNAISVAIAATADVEQIERHVDRGVQSSFLKQAVLYLTSKPTDTVATKFLEFFVMDGAAEFNGLPFLRLAHEVSTAYSTSTMRILNYCMQSLDLSIICPEPVRILFRVFEKMAKLQHPERVRYARALSDGYFSELRGHDMNPLTGTLALLLDIAEKASGRESNSYQKLRGSRKRATEVPDWIKNKFLARGKEGVILAMNAQCSGDGGTDPIWLKRVFGGDSMAPTVNAVNVAEHANVAPVV